LKSASIGYQYINIVEVSFFGVTRTIQKRDGIVHVIAESFWHPQTLLGAKPASSGSRAFH